MSTEKILNDLTVRYPALSVCKTDIGEAYSVLEKCFLSDNRLYICGNGGSAADALHIVGELVKPFVLNRKLDKSFIERVDDAELISNLHGALSAIALVENAPLITAITNDCNSEYVFAQQVYAYAREGDCVLGISTSGNSKNVIHAINTAKGRGAFTLGLTGRDGGEMCSLCDVCICVPETETYKVQELHLPVYHALCLMLEQRFFGE
jgi:D-sedoheptulose 7-phosphate isomerase